MRPNFVPLHRRRPYPPEKFPRPGRWPHAGPRPGNPPNLTRAGSSGRESGRGSRCERQAIGHVPSLNATPSKRQGRAGGWVGRPPRSSKGSTRSPPPTPLSSAPSLRPRADNTQTQTHTHSLARTLAFHLKLPMTTIPSNGCCDGGGGGGGALGLLRIPPRAVVGYGGNVDLGRSHNLAHHHSYLVASE